MTSSNKKDFNFQYISTMIRSNAIIIHTCSKQDYKKYHLRGSWHINTTTVDKNSQNIDKTKLFKKLKHRLQGLPENTCIILLDNNCQISPITKSLLETLGYINVAILGGTEIEPLLSIMLSKTKVKGLDICDCIKSK